MPSIYVFTNNPASVMVGAVTKVIQSKASEKIPTPICKNPIIMKYPKILSSVFSLFCIVLIIDLISKDFEILPVVKYRYPAERERMKLANDVRVSTSIPKRASKTAIPVESVPS